MSEDVITNLDFLLERERKPAGRVLLGGKEYEVFRVDTLEDFLTFMATVERVQAQMKRVENPDELDATFEDMRKTLRKMVRVLCPGMSDEFLREKFHDLERLHRLFSALVMAVEQRLPESVKKNSETEAKAKETGKPSTSCSLSEDSPGIT